MGSDEVWYGGHGEPTRGVERALKSLEMSRANRFNVVDREQRQHAEFGVLDLSYDLVIRSMTTIALR